MLLQCAQEALLKGRFEFIAQGVLESVPFFLPSIPLMLKILFYL
jgi:hypothetical protein